MKKLLIVMLSVFTLVSCHQQDTSVISLKTITNLQQQLVEANPTLNAEQIGKGVEQAAALWCAEDGTEAEFAAFVEANIASNPEQRELLFKKLSTALEALNGTNNMLSTKLQMPMHLVGDELTEVDYILGAYTPFSHLSDDLFANKLAFIIVLNFPHYTLAEKDSLGGEWSRQEWAYARLGDLFTSRVPAAVNQAYAEVYTAAENYIAGYNIMMGHLLTEEGERIFPEDMVLLSHWNLRDELKSNYADVPHANEKQEMIYTVMEHIVCQTIPDQVVNNPDYDWKPYSNTLQRSTASNASSATFNVQCSNLRYQQLLDIFHATRASDSYSPALPTAIDRNFEGTMEVSAERIEELFTELISSEQVARVGELIKQRLGRNLRPYDIWYDGFKARATMPEEQLSIQTRKRYPDEKAFERDMPNLLQKLGFAKADAEYIASKIVVENARGSGHAWGAQGRWEPSRLRTRIPAGGMDYKGYNIAVHEFGHNVEQTLDLYNIDYYTLAGVPNTAFTEALAFIFQKRDLQLLGYPYQMDDNTVLDIFWGAYEIMGVALVDLKTWQWLYSHPDATASELRDATVQIAKDLWNNYYEPILGTHDSPILAVYSHMINSPLYLANYPFGHLIEFQLEEHLAKAVENHPHGSFSPVGETGEGLFAAELYRIYTLGRLTPDLWMQQAVGSPVSVQPLLKAVDAILQKEEKSSTTLSQNDIEKSGKS